MRRLGLWVALAFASILAGCMTAPKALVRPPASYDRHAVTVLYGTDRVRVGGEEYYSKARADRLELGRAVVSIPPNHTQGVIERPSILRLEFTEDDNKHIVLKSKPAVLSEAQFIAEAKATSVRSALLFVHGYNTTFAGGMYRAAQLQYDLNFSGPVFYYSWPSAANVLAYDYDNDSERQAEDHLLAFLNIIVVKARVRNITIIAHSKGNDLTLSALQRLPAGALRSDSLNQLILASPDVDANRARNVIGAVKGRFKGVTLYANNNDAPLMASAQKAGARRAGHLLDDGYPLIVPKVDSIDATAAMIDWAGLNHNAYVFDDKLRFDLQGVVAGRRPPEQRNNALRKNVLGDGRAFWRLH